MHRAKGDKLVRARVFPVCDNVFYFSALSESLYNSLKKWEGYSFGVVHLSVPPSGTISAHWSDLIIMV